MPFRLKIVHNTVIDIWYFLLIAQVLLSRLGFVSFRTNTVHWESSHTQSICSSPSRMSQCFRLSRSANYLLTYTLTMHKNVH